MKKLMALIPLVLMLACSIGGDKNPATLKSQDQQFGTCVVALPKIALAKSSTEKFIFDLVITSQDMEPMKFSWNLSGADTQASVSKIPAGDMRIFTGTLTSSIAGITHFGSDTVAIVAGKTAYVSLYLRSTGNAVVDVIIEGPKTPGMTGCYAFEGRIDTTMFKNTILQIRSDSLSPQMLGYLMQNGQMVGKVYGPQPSVANSVYWTISFPSAGLFALKVYGDLTAFKGTVYSSSDTARSLGYASGFKTSCDTVLVPPPAPTVTINGCYTFEGSIDTTKFVNSILQIFPGSTTEITGVVMQNGQAIAKVQGPQPSLNSPPVSWYVGLAYSGSYILKVTTDGTGSYYKSIAFNSSDTTKAVGSVWGAKTSCDTVVVNPTCVIDTMGDETSCKDLGTWQKYVSSTCAERGMILNWINPLVPCTSSLEKAYKWVCFECCNAKPTD